MKQIKILFTSVGRRVELMYIGGKGGETGFFLRACSDYIIQPFIEGREYMVDILCDFEGNPIYATPREHLAVRSGEYGACIVHNRC